MLCAAARGNVPQLAQSAVDGGRVSGQLPVGAVASSAGQEHFGACLLCAYLCVSVG